MYSDLNTLIALVFKSEYFCVTSIQEIQGIHEYFYRFKKGRCTGPSKREFTTEFRSEYNRVSSRLPTTRGVDRRSAIWGSPRAGSPPCSTILFSAGRKKVHADDLSLLDPNGGVDAANDGGYYARWGEPAPQNLGVHAGTHHG